MTANERRNAKNRCHGYIEKEYNPPRNSVISRRSCKRLTNHPSGYCLFHRYMYRGPEVWK